MISYQLFASLGDRDHSLMVFIDPARHVTLSGGLEGVGIGLSNALC